MNDYLTHVEFLHWLYSTLPEDELVRACYKRLESLIEDNCLMQAELQVLRSRGQFT